MGTSTRAGGTLSCLPSQGRRVQLGCGVILLTLNLQCGDPNCSHVPPPLVSLPGSLRDKPKLSPRHWGAQDTNFLPVRPQSALSPLSRPGMAWGHRGGEGTEVSYSRLG